MPAHGSFAPSCIEACTVGTALDGMCVGLVLTDPAGRISWMNRVAQRQLCLSRKPDAYGLPLSKFLPDPPFAEFWLKACSSTETLMAEIPVRHPTTASLKVNATRCVESDGICTGRVLLFCDVSAEKAVQVRLSEEATEVLLGLAQRWDKSPGTPAGLTPQELRILRQVGKGLGNEEIASRMGVAPSTVRSHLKRVYRKTGVGSRSEAVRYAIQNHMA